MVHEKVYEEQMHHKTAELPIALHRLEYPEGTDILFYLHWHQEFEFLVVTGGYIEFTIEDRTYTLSPNDCVFINSNFYHSARASAKSKCSFFAVDFSYEFLIENLNTHFAREYIRPVLNGNIIFPEMVRGKAAPPDSWQAQAIAHLQDINCCPEDALAVHELMIKTRIYQVWELFYIHAVCNNKQSTMELMEKNRLKPVLDFIRENYSYEITLSELSELLPMSEGQFCRVFKDVMRLSPFQYLMRYRIMQSCSLLIETDKKIGEIANLSGFNNISYYNRVFYKIIHCTPKQYRLYYNE